jgi:hypothetical protein
VLHNIQDGNIFFAHLELDFIIFDIRNFCKHKGVTETTTY